MKKYKIAHYPGDGIGVDVTASGLTVLDAARRKFGEFETEVVRLDWGVDYHLRNGSVTPEGFIDRLREFDAIFLGAIGYPEILPDYVTLEPLIKIRQAFDQYACVRPARTYPGVTCPLAGVDRIDMVVVRENSEGEYVNNGGRFHQGAPEEFAVQSALHTRRGIERVLRFGFELAETRSGRLTMITKSNAQRYGFVLWDEILEEVSADFPDIVADKQHIDAAAMNFVRRPDAFDVVVASNLFGDILTDLSGAITGSLGLNPSANLNPERRFPSLFEPVHGSAPDIAGKGIANPVAAILSVAMMLEWLGEDGVAQPVRESVASALADGQGTPDVGGGLSTDEMTAAVVERL
jgi:tartrate dehydrogenase/decarboxylase/D-malate dehydrogenase